MKYVYLDLENNVIHAIAPKSVASERLVSGCQEVLVPFDFDHRVPYVNENGQDRTRDTTATEFLESLTYAEKRFAEYPSIADQLDTLYHGGIDAWRAQIQAVKDQFPKPGAPE